MNNTNFRKHRDFSIVIAAFHLAIAVFLFVRGILDINKLSKELNGILIEPADYWMTGIFGIISFFLLLMLIKLLNKKLEIDKLKKLSNSLNLQCIFGILFSFFYGGHLYFNENQKVIGSLIFAMIIVEIIYIILSRKFLKKAVAQNALNSKT